MTPTNDLYNQHEKLMKKLAWSLTKALPLTLDEALSEVYLIFTESQTAWDAQKGKFSTFLWFCFKNHVVNLFQKNKAQKRAQEYLMSFEDIQNITANNTLTPETLLISKENRKENPFMEAIWEILQTEKIPEKGGIKTWINQHLRKQGWMYKEIWAGWKSF